MSTPVRAMAAALDDTALEALAPRGIVRRAGADVEAGRAALVTESPDAAELTVDGETVHLTAKGPRESRCSCPAPGFCRHRLAALILLRDSKEASTEEDAKQGEEPATDLVDWSLVAADFTEERLARFASKAGWRQVLAERAGVASAEVLQLVGAFQVRLGGGQEPVVFLAQGGLEAALTKAADKDRKAVVALAALAMRHALGLPDLEAGPAPEPATAEAGARPDPQTLAAVRDLLKRLYRAALAFAPLSLEDETRRLAVAGRVDALPRLSGLLRAIAGGIASLRRREAGADPETLLARLGEAYALSLALENLQDPDALSLVMGVVRQRYDPIGGRTLFGLGARLWETDGGAHGVTAYFHDPEHDRDFRLSQARADRSDVTFTAEEAFRRPIWGAPMSQLAVSEVALRDGAASASGRLSTGQATTATTGAWTPRPEGIRNWRCAADDWQALETRLQGTFAPGLARPRIEDTAVILVQTRTAPLRFDDLTQSLIWPVADSQGRWIGLTLPYEGIERARIEALERQAQATRFWAILAIAQPVEDRFELHPYGLWSDRLVMLDFDREDRRRRGAAITPAAGLGLIQRLKGLGGRKAGDNLAFRTGGSPTGRALDEAWALLMRRAELGHGQSDATFASQAQALADRLNSVGLTFPGRQFHALSEAPSPEEACLAAAWAITLTRRSRTTLPWMT